MDYDGKDSGPKNTYYVVKPVPNEDFIIALTYRGVQNSQRPELQVFNWDGQILARYELAHVRQQGTVLTLPWHPQGKHVFPGFSCLAYRGRGRVSTLARLTSNTTAVTSSSKH